MRRLPTPLDTLPWLPLIGEGSRCQGFSARTKILDSGCSPQYNAGGKVCGWDFQENSLIEYVVFLFESYSGIMR